jgi:hypothetical protein
MKDYFKISGLLAVSILASPAAVIWTGATSSDVFDDSNWDFSGSIESAVDFNVSVLDDVTILNGNAEIADVAAQGRFQIGNGFTLTLDNSILGAANNDGAGGEPSGTGITINVINGSQFNPFFVVNNVAVNIDGTSSATFGGGGNPINIATIDLKSGSVLAFLAETPAAFTAEHLSKVTVYGAPAVDGVNIVIEAFNGASGSRVTAIPEPTSTLLVALGGLAFVVRRRK